MLSGVGGLGARIPYPWDQSGLCYKVTATHPPYSTAFGTVSLLGQGPQLELTPSLSSSLWCPVPGAGWDSACLLNE
jgi:hypothetical protein